MKTDIRKKIDELEEKRISLLIKEADSALEKLFKEHGVSEVRLVKDPHESETMQAVVAPGIRFIQDVRTFRFTRFALVNKIVQTKVQEVASNGTDEIFFAESDWMPIYMLKKDEDVDINSVHIDRTIQWLADCDYAWENNQYIPDMFADDDIDPFDKPYEDLSCIKSDKETGIDETECLESSNNDESVVELLGKLNDEKYAATENFNQMIWEKGIPALIDRMKEYGIRKLPIFQTAAPVEDLWGFIEEEDDLMAINSLELDHNGNPYIIYNGVIKSWESGTWERDFGIVKRSPITEELVGIFLPNIIEGLLTHTDIYEGEAAEENEEKEEIASRLEEFNGEEEMCDVFSEMFQLEYIDLANVDTSNATTLQGFFYHCSGMRSVDVSVLDTRNCETFESMFDGCESLTEITFGNFNTVNAKSMQEMFRSCHALTSIDLSSFNTDCCENMSMMFKDCHSLSSLDFSNLNMTNVDDFSDMFEGCNKLSNIILRNPNQETIDKISEALEKAGLDNVEIIAN